MSGAVDIGAAAQQESYEVIPPGRNRVHDRGPLIHRICRVDIYITVQQRFDSRWVPDHNGISETLIALFLPDAACDLTRGIRMMVAYRFSKWGGRPLVVAILRQWIRSVIQQKLDNLGMARLGRFHQGSHVPVATHIDIGP